MSMKKIASPSIPDDYHHCVRDDKVTLSGGYKINMLGMDNAQTGWTCTAMLPVRGTNQIRGHCLDLISKLIDCSFTALDVGWLG